MEKIAAQFEILIDETTPIVHYDPAPLTQPHPFRSTRHCQAVAPSATLRTALCARKTKNAFMTTLTSSPKFSPTALFSTGDAQPQLPASSPQPEQEAFVTYNLTHAPQRLKLQDYTLPAT
ncbi:hypothetical protein HPB48_002602 [Haemaphysalis longicornis]|uniref:Uncharacterized protein n=1 Tax=Haemaphysalis longicornis TaxID=44386 RepID=A0A9J6G3T7_HAELO|nr:hypothetical protein HPB48_002602 [Haemaphysalis longicornis]